MIKKSSIDSPYGTTNPPIDWKTICEIIDYPNDPFVNKEKVMSTHFARVLTDIKILSIWGKHTFPYKF